MGVLGGGESSAITQHYALTQALVLVPPSDTCKSLVNTEMPVFCSCSACTTCWDSAVCPEREPEVKLNFLFLPKALTSPFQRRVSAISEPHKGRKLSNMAPGCSWALLNWCVTSHREACCSWLLSTKTSHSSTRRGNLTVIWWNLGCSLPFQHQVPLPRHLKNVSFKNWLCSYPSLSMSQLSFSDVAFRLLYAGLPSFCCKWAGNRVKCWQDIFKPNNSYWVLAHWSFLQCSSHANAAIPCLLLAQFHLFA